MKKYFALLVFLLFFLLPKTVDAHTETQIIKMVPGGFEPQEVSVDENSAVIFINQDTIPRWPASNLHPTHDLYPEFDPKGEIKPGESWAFKPKNAGVWKYHDHLEPHLRGILTVTAETPVEDEEQHTKKLGFVGTIKKYVNSTFEWFRSLFEKTPKHEEFKKLTSEKQFEVLEKLAKKKGAKSAWEFVLKTYEGEAGSSGNIHDLAHLSGKLMYDEGGIGSISSCTPIFAFGCYHGLLDAAFKTSLADLLTAEKECARIGPVNSGPYGSCVHGIGHGVASFHTSLDIRAALADCGKLPAGQDYCSDGVFMEFVRSAPSYYSKDKPFYPCDMLEGEFGDKYSLSCGRNQPTVFVSKLGLEFSDAAGLCGKNSLSDKFKSSCFDALGFILASTQDPAKIISGCKSISSANYSSLCLKSAAGELIFQEVPGWEEKSNEVCSASNPNVRTACQENLKRLIKEYGRDAKGLLNLFIKDGQNEEEYVRSQMGICLEGGSRASCYQQAAGLFSQQFGLKKTLNIFASNEQYPEIYSRCHEATHYLSRNEYKKTRSIAAVYVQCDSTCHGGCYHGVLEQYLKEKNLQADKLYAEFPKVCGKTDDYASPLVYNECMHGLGHAAMFIYDTEVPDSLRLCDTLPVQEHKERCYSGVFMENSSSSTNNEHPGKYIKAEDPFYPCNWLEEKYSKICWRYQSSYFALITKHDWVQTAALCQKVPDKYQDDCFRTVGTNQVGFTQDAGVMHKNCGLMPTVHFQEICLKGVISSFAYRFVGDEKRMENFCSGAQEQFQEACFKQMGTSVVDWSKDSAEALAWCKKIGNPQFSSWCESAVN